MKSAGAATSKIAEALGVSRSTVYRYLNRLTVTAVPNNSAKNVPNNSGNNSLGL